MDTTFKSFLFAVIAIIALGFIVGYDRIRVDKENKKESPFDSTVLWEKTSCIKTQDRCFQELKFDIKGQTIYIINAKQPFLKKDDKAKLIKRYKPPLGLPLCNKGANCSGIELRYSYHIYDSKK